MDRPIHNPNPFTESAAGCDPFILFEQWFAAAVAADPSNAGVAALATAGADGRPSLRMVLLKGSGPDGWIFYTNYESRKGTELEINPQAAMTFWWPALERQVRLEGPVRKLPPGDSDAYFASRPVENQLSAWASPQSRIIGEALSLDAQRNRFGSGPIPRPPCWGGYRLIPDRIEFWQGRSDRLHDRILFTRRGAEWKTVRLAP